MKYSFSISDFLKRSLVLPILLFSSISLHWYNVPSGKVLNRLYSIVVIIVVVSVFLESPFSLQFYYLLNFYWCIVNSQCCANLSCTKWLSFTHTHTHMYIHSFLNIIFHYSLSQDIEYSSLWYTVGPCCSWFYPRCHSVSPLNVRWYLLLTNIYNGTNHARLCVKQLGLSVTEANKE